ncbi:ferrous iron transport protein B [Blautia sp. 2744]|uniref:Ferrous iron transport protein B n=1 Tax=Blautia intestinalis TaxID=2763028 RepID=A0ABR7I2F8_9FIRM|nr:MULTISPECIES: ferrous iron transport protein B [Blautia]MBC5740575.1 ferrous iron transport protein B [Blautia intestinalis]RHA48323.1 ferrous iron transport protein B [Blautia obeum]RHD34061.1 ferrous iron transport protein B [Blautia obeum]
MAIKIALAGNPNCGKTTMFNALTGANQYVGNWPGVTVEKKEGKLKGKKGKGEDIIVTDLPGIYSLSPYTLEEVVSRDYVLKENPDVIIDLVDATNIERNLYLTTQLIETGVPVVIALNMADLLEKRGIKIDTKRLSMLLDCPIIETSALKGEGLDKLIDEAVKTAKKSSADLPKEIFTKEMEEAISEVKEVLPSSITEDKKRWYAVKFLENDEKVKEAMKLSASGQSLVDSKRQDLEKKHDDDLESIVTDERYKFIQKIVNTTVKKAKDKLTVSDKIDRIVTNRILGIPIFVAVMWLVYYVSVTTVGTFVTDWTNDVFVVAIQNFFTNILTGIGASDMVMGLVVDGIIGGLGAVLGFVPQMAILFLFLSILEDCGYMVRIAFVMDRVFRHFGLSGKSFIPLLISSGCGIPGIMASKTIEQDNDRRLTIMTATFIPCGAKLPVIALMGGVIAGETAGYAESSFIAPLMYFIGIVAVLVAAIILKKTKPFSGKPAPFVMELPQYHIPQVKTVLLHVWERLKGFIIKAGTILFLACVVMWFLGGFGFTDGGFGMVEDSADSLMAAIGGVIAPIFAPLGFGEWQPVAASISGFTAKEAIVSTMGVLANVAGDTEDAVNVAAGVASWFPTGIAAFSFLMFNLLDSPCLAAIATMAKEMNDRKWFWFAILFQNIFAYIVCLCFYQIGSFVTGGAFGIGTVVGFAVLIVMLFLLFRPDPYKDQKVYSKRSVQA